MYTIQKDNCADWISHDPVPCLPPQHSKILNNYGNKTAVIYKKIIAVIK